MSTSLHEFTITIQAPVQSSWAMETQRFVLKSLPEQVPNVNDLANHFHVSSRQLTRIIKRHTGHTPAKLVKEIQLDFSLRLIRQCNGLSIAQIAYMSGFEYSSTFSTVFKKRYGQPPTRTTASLHNSL